MKSLITFFSLIILSLPGFAQLTWQAQNSGVNRELTDVCFTGYNTGWISGWTGTILTTGDRGLDWTQQDPPPTNAYWTLDFTDDQNGWAAGYAGLIVHTTDGGDTWTIQSSLQNYDIYSIDFINNEEGWAAGGAYGGFPSGIDSRIILHTNDGGANWTVQHGESYKKPLKSIMFVDADHGFATGEGGIVMKTTNGGENWTEMVVNSSFHFNEIFFVNDMEGYVVAQYLGLPHYAAIFKSTDGGENWAETQLGEGESLSGIYFTDEYNGWTVGGSNNNGLIYHTSDGGVNWESEDVPEDTPYLYSVFFIDEYNGWAVGHLGTIISTVIGAVGVDEFTNNPSQQSETFSLGNNYPNPFTSTTRISYKLPAEEKVSLKIYSITGQLVRTLVDETAQAGEHEVSWDGTNDAGSKLTSGIYLFQLTAGDQAQTRRINLVK